MRSRARTMAPAAAAAAASAVALVVTLLATGADVAAAAASAAAAAQAGATSAGSDASTTTAAAVFAQSASPLSSSSPSQADFGATLGFQAHSYNDLREWYQLFSKGTRYLKLDPHWVSANATGPDGTTFCAAQERVRDPTDVRGCMVLNHDDPVVARTTYNTTDDILEALGTPLLNKFFTAPLTFRISLCFKSAPGPCDGTVAAAQWTDLVDEFVDEANAIIKQHKLNVEFILDGDSAPKDCLAQRWRPWAGVWITGDDPQAAFTSSNATLGYDRFQILNEPVISWGLAAMFKFGKFADSNRTMLVWEPSDQDTIKSVADTYEKTGLLHTAGVRYAINVDVAQWSLYAAPSSGRGWHTETGVGTSPTDPGIAVVAGVGDNSAPFNVALAAFWDGGKPYVTAMAFNGTTGPALGDWTKAVRLPQPGGSGAVQLANGHLALSTIAIGAPVGAARAAAGTGTGNAGNILLASDQTGATVVYLVVVDSVHSSVNLTVVTSALLSPPYVEPESSRRLRGVDGDGNDGGSGAVGERVPAPVGLHERETSATSPLTVSAATVVILPDQSGAAVTASDAPLLVIQAFAGAEATGCAVLLQVWEFDAPSTHAGTSAARGFDDDSAGGGAVPIGTATCVAALAGIGRGAVSGVSVAAAGAPFQQRQQRQQQQQQSHRRSQMPSTHESRGERVSGYTDVVEAVVSFAAGNHSIYSAVACLNVSSGASWVNDPNSPCTVGPGVDDDGTGAATWRGGARGANALPEPVQTHVGSHPSMSVAFAPSRSHGGTPRAFFLHTHTDGFCPNCETRNKQPTAGVCDLEPAMTPGILNYAAGSVDDFVQHLGSAGAGGAPAWFSACSHTILHGAYDQGTATASALFTVPRANAAAVGSVSSSPAVAGPAASDPVQSFALPRQLGFVEVHEGLGSAAANSECGAPSKAIGLVSDSFDLSFPPLALPDP